MVGLVDIQVNAIISSEGKTGAGLVAKLHEKVIMEAKESWSWASDIWEVNLLAVRWALGIAKTNLVHSEMFYRFNERAMSDDPKFGTHLTGREAYTLNTHTLFHLSSPFFPSHLMESPTPVSRYISQNSKKRVFLAEGSSSGCKEVEVLEVTPPANRSSKPKSSKQKEVVSPEIIDVDMDEDSDVLMLNDQDVFTSAKGKEVLSSSSGGIDGVANDEPSALLHDSLDPDDFGSNQYYGEDEWIDTYYDDILSDDDYDATLESHFDHMDIPPGVEMSFPWLPTSPKNDSKVPTASSSSTQTTTKTQTTNTNLSPPLNSLLPPDDTQIGDMSTLWDYPVADHQHFQGKPSSKWIGTDFSKKTISGGIGNHYPLSYGSNAFHKMGKEPLVSTGKSKRKSPASHVLSSYYHKFPSAPFHSSAAGGGGSYGVASYSPGWQEFPIDPVMETLSPSGLMDDNQFSMDILMGASRVEPSQPVKVEPRNLDEVLRRFDSFKKFDTVEDYSDHQYAKNGGSTKQPPSSWAKKIQEEWKILEKDLPGAEGTPYHDGLFFFDVFFPSSYPNVPPHVHYHSRGLRINPNLYNCGKVCLSLLNTWSGSQKEKWIPGVSTMLQVLVSIQGLILNAKPYFNEPGYAHMDGTVMGEKCSLEYNERTFIYNLQTMVYNMRRPPKHFEDFAIGYFCKHARAILVSCRAYLDGAQVGCLVKGGVQDVDEGDKSCSQEFKASLRVFMTTLVNQFVQIGAKDCDEFLYLSQLEKTRAGAHPVTDHQ
ncbi:ubiquitin conjugating enzyme [Striga asiatica]|uniref:Ubiquitin conjugating enzyme n=1 Tax=Striga asiatica TaxID=4170 RepID=A0A5A7RHC5_STRAF|nr:ubiquitin conjugating enzyme [Striga asiatica]